MGGTIYSYTTTPQDTMDSLLSALADLISQDPNVTAAVDFAASTLNLQLKDPAAGLNIRFSVFATAQPPFRVNTAFQHLVAGVANATNTVSATIGKALPVVPGDILFGGTPEPGETITVSLLQTPYTYTILPGDTLQTVVSKLTEQINNDPNVSATADLANLKISLQIRDATQKPSITFTVAVPEGSSLIAITRSNETTNAITAPVAFAGLVKGSAGLYQVNFTVPDTVQPSPNAALIIRQNLIVFGSVTEFNIFSNPVEFPIGE